LRTYIFYKYYINKYLKYKYNIEKEAKDKNRTTITDYFIPNL